MISAPILYFLATVAITLVITVWAARRSTGRASLYAASGNVTATQNGLAIAGDFLSAGTVLGIVGLYFIAGVDVSLYFIAPMAGFALLMVLIVGPLRRMGRYTLGDVVMSKVADKRMRVVLGLCTIVISLINLIAQLVGAGGLISVVFGLSFNQAVVVVGLLMTAYVVLGGMLAATWVQIIKAVLLIGSVLLLAALCLNAAGGLGPLYNAAANVRENGADLFSFGKLDLGAFSAISLSLGLALGMMGSPHVLIRFFTVKDEAAARRSLMVATLCIGLAMGTVFFIVSPAAVAFVTGNPAFTNEGGAVIGGSNMITLHLARAMGGDIFFGVMAAVAFSTILAVVAGLTVAISTSASHDLFANLSRSDAPSEKSELWVFRVSAFAAAAAAVAMAILFQHENLTFLIVTGLAVSASTTFPLLFLAIYWSKLTAEGAIAGGIVGLATSVGLIIASPSFWVNVLKHEEPIFFSDFPALISVPAAFAAAILVSIATARKPIAAAA